MKPIAVAALAAALFLTACADHQVQTSSGADWLSRYEAPPALPAQQAGEGAAPGLDERVRMAAAVEPLLRFPARIGLARVVNRRLTTLPADEAAIWAELAEAHAELGSFVAVQPLIAASAVADTGGPDLSRGWSDPSDVIATIRIGAARQHIDAVLVYEAGVRADKTATGLGFADLTIIGGAILPTRSIEVEGRAAALLLDVRNGYPYGTATASADLSRLSPSWGSDRRMERMQGEALLEVTRRLVPEVEAMFTGLLAARQAAGPDS
ncbi:hypothetical protein [Oceanicella sp. SM1341]|uniref:hypothetical protein n=1 Tax=Oceanicella sp. SM1341 TaxID=1548889 RepID=UPI000E506136|nr:hypothetical protein [Oceanicella sp. SM1341]